MTNNPLISGPKCENCGFKWDFYDHLCPECLDMVQWADANRHADGRSPMRLVEMLCGPCLRTFLRVSYLQINGRERSEEEIEEAVREVTKQAKDGTVQ